MELHETPHEEEEEEEKLHTQTLWAFVKWTGILV